jgi:hypothetical protein
MSLQKDVEYDEEKEVRTFVPILKGETDIFDKAREFCTSRKIPKEVWEQECLVFGR